MADAHAAAHHHAVHQGDIGLGTRAEKALWVGLTQVKGDLEGKTPQAKSAVSRLLKRKVADDLGACLKAWAACNDIDVQLAPLPGRARYCPVAQARTWKAALEPRRVLASRWWTASFSALTREVEPDPTDTAVPATERDERIDDARVDNTEA
ncbi:hypothetical protein, partial [Roseateles sp.]|uniref:hypothetical protein n=1 Tax=Roseateles sp. TaxID=1971397 RepID=UPI00286BEDF1